MTAARNETKVGIEDEEEKAKSTPRTTIRTSVIFLDNLEGMS